MQHSYSFMLFESNLKFDMETPIVNAHLYYCLVKVSSFLTHTWFDIAFPIDMINIIVHKPKLIFHLNAI
jgi:hypothetical protein